MVFDSLLARWESHYICGEVVVFSAAERSLVSLPLHCAGLWLWEDGEESGLKIVLNEALI